VGPDRFHEVGRAAVVEEEDPLAKAPQRGSPELVATSRALQDVVGEPWPHLVQGYVGEQIHVLLAQGRHSGVVGRPERRGVAEGAADVSEALAAPRDRE
jgi:hypothetical protein